VSEALAWPATPPAPDAPDVELAALMWSLIPGDYLTGAGWDPVRRVLTPPIGHPTLGSRSCPVPGCTSPVKGLKLCATCQHLHRDSGLPYEEFVVRPRTARVRSTQTCSVNGCGRPRIDNGNRRICRAHWYRLQVRGGTLGGVPDRPVCEAAAQPGRLRGAGLHPGSGQSGRPAAVRDAPPADGPPAPGRCGRGRAEWLRTNDAASQGTEVSFRGLPDLVAAQLLFGIYQRSMKHAKTEAG
jgi:hypothetical protein